MAGLVKYGKAWLIAALCVRALTAITLAGAVAGAMLGDGVSLTIQIMPGG